MQRLYMMGVVEVKTLVGGSATAEKRDFFRYARAK
jgi:hypothetical protein